MHKSQVDFPMSVLMKLFSRFNEYQADRYSVAANRQYGRFLGTLAENVGRCRSSRLQHQTHCLPFWFVLVLFVVKSGKRELQPTCFLWNYLDSSKISNFFFWNFGVASGDALKKMMRKSKARLSTGCHFSSKRPGEDVVVKADKAV